MAFERAKITIKPASIGTGVKVGLAKVRNASAKMRFSVSAAVAKDLGWADGDKLEILIGTAEHHGLVRMRKNNSVGEAVVTRRETRNGPYFQISLGHQSAFVDRVEAARWCQFEKVEDGFVEIVLPRWADETAKMARASIAPGSVLGRTSPAVQPVRGASVTSVVMGDPPPGRREMLAKIGTVNSRGVA